MPAGPQFSSVSVPDLGHSTCNTLSQHGLWTSSCCTVQVSCPLTTRVQLVRFQWVRWPSTTLKVPLRCRAGQGWASNEEQSRITESSICMLRYEFHENSNSITGSKQSAPPLMQAPRIAAGWPCSHQRGQHNLGRPTQTVSCLRHRFYNTMAAARKTTEEMTATGCQRTSLRVLEGFHRPRKKCRGVTYRKGFCPGSQNCCVSPVLKSRIAIARHDSHPRRLHRRGRHVQWGRLACAQNQTRVLAVSRGAWRHVDRGRKTMCTHCGAICAANNGPRCIVLSSAQTSLHYLVCVGRQTH